MRPRLEDRGLHRASGGTSTDRARLDADDLDPWLQRLGGDGDPRYQPTASDRHDQRVEVGLVGEHFEADRALSGDDRPVVVGVDRHQPLVARQHVGGLARRDEAVAFEHDAGAQRLGAVDLGERSALGHHDRRRDAEPPRVKGDALRVVAGRHRDHPGAALVLVERQQLVERAALLERAGRMLRLQLQARPRSRRPRRG